MKVRVECSNHVDETDSRNICSTKILCGHTFEVIVPDFMIERGTWERVCQMCGGRLTQKDMIGEGS